MSATEHPGKHTDKHTHEPVPYTAPDYDPDGSGRPAATTPTATPGSERRAPESAAPDSAAGEGSAAGKEPQPYVDPGYDPDKG